MNMMCAFGTMMYVEISWYDPFMPVNNHTELGFAGIQVARAWCVGYEMGISVIFFLVRIVWLNKEEEGWGEGNSGGARARARARGMGWG